MRVKYPFPYALGLVISGLPLANSTAYFEMKLVINQ